MTKSRLMVGLALVGAAAATIWSVSTDGDGSKASAAGEASSIAAPPTGMSVHQTYGQAQLGVLPIAPSHDHGFIFAP